MKKITFFLLLLLSMPAMCAHPAKGSEAPALNFTKILNLPDGTKADLASLKGKVVVLEFWATWCGPCRQTLPHLNEMASKLDPAKFQLIMVNKKQSEKKVRAYMREWQIAGWSALDEHGEMSRSYNVGNIPLTVIIDSEGRIAGVTHPNYVLYADVKALIEGKPVQFKEIKY